MTILRDRLVGELVADADRVAATLSPDFELTSHPGRGVAVPRSTIVDSIRRNHGAGMTVWVDLDDLVLDADRIAAHGTLHTLTPLVDATDDRSAGAELTSCPLAIFLRFTGDLMSHEVIHLDPSGTSTTRLDPARLRSTAELLTLVTPGNAAHA